jgi:hypothetical protein
MPLEAGQVFVVKMVCVSAYYSDICGAFGCPLAERNVSAMVAIGCG